MTEMLGYPAIFVTIGLVLSAHLFHINFRRKDGLGRIILLIFIGGLLAYYAWRFAIQINYYVLENITGRQASDISKHAQTFLLAPLLIVGYIEFKYRRK